jgi:hypothetical protein
MAESHPTEILRFAASIIARHGSQAVGFVEAVVTHFQAAGSDIDARQWTSICTAIHDIEQAVPLPNLNPIGWPSGPGVPAAVLAERQDKDAG